MVNIERSELEIFKDLKKLCTSPGYIHAFARICFKDLYHTVGVDKNYEIVESLDISKLYSHDRLIRSEMSTLHGLLISEDIDYLMPSQEKFEDYICKTDLLLKEIHQAILKPSNDALIECLKNGRKDNPFIRGECLREPIFYSAESAYDFQYLELFIKKYEKDNEWLINNKGVDINDVVLVAQSIICIQQMKAELYSLGIQDQFPVLDIFVILVDEVVYTANKYETTIDYEKAVVILDLFVGDNNRNFTTVNEYNWS